MFERRTDPVVPLPIFFGRLRRFFVLAAGLVTIALSVGLLGYHFIGKLDWIDALLNASMILTGMGPVDPMKTAGAKVFASVFALFSGVVFLSSLGIVLSPIYHRFMHKFHFESAADSDETDS